MADAVTSLQISVEARDETTRVLKGIESSIIRFVGAVSAALATVSVAVFPLKAAADFQKELLNVGKTTGFTDTQLTILGESLKGISTQMNVSTVDLAKIAAAGGQMGLGMKEGVAGLVAFTEATARFAAVLDVPAEEAAPAIAKLINIYDIAVGDAERIASLLNGISNSSTANGRELIDMMQRIGTAGGTLGIQQSAALSAYGRDLGLTVETVGTSFNKIFLDLQSKSEEAAKVAGLPVEVFADMLRTNGLDALKAYLTGLSKLTNTQRSILAEQITGGGRLFALVTAGVNDASNGYQLLNKHINTAGKEWSSGTSAIKEQERVMQGLSAQLEILKNVFFNLAEAIGQRALPYITALTKQLQDWGKDPVVLQWLQEFGSSIGGSIASVIGFLKSVTSLSNVLGPLAATFGLFIKFKIASMFVDMAGAMLRNAQAANATARSWLGMAAANKEVVRSLSDKARALEADGKAGTKVNTTGRASMFVSGLFEGYWAKQDAAAASAAKEAEAQQNVSRTLAEKTANLAKYNTLYADLLAKQKAEGQIAKANALAGGASNTDANKAARARERQFDLPVQNAKDRVNAERTRQNAVLKTERAILATAKTEAAASAASLASTSKLGSALDVLRTRAATAGAAMATMFRSALAGAAMFLGAVGVVASLLSMFGLLDPLIAGFQKLFGISNKAHTEEVRASEARRQAMEEERRKASDLADQYDKVVDSWSVVRNNDKTGLGERSVDSVNELVKRVELAHGKFTNLNLQSADLEAQTSFAAAQWERINAQLVEAKTNYKNLQDSKALGQVASALKGGLSGILGGAQAPTADSQELLTAKARVDELTRSLHLMDSARKSASTGISEMSAAAASASAMEAAQTAQLAAVYDAEGYKLLQFFEQIVKKRDELTKAAEALRVAESRGFATSDDKDERALYTERVANARLLEAETNSLSNAFKELRANSTLSASEFFTAIVPSETAAKLEGVQRFLRILGGISGDTTDQLRSDAKRLEEQVEETQGKLNELESKRQQALAANAIDSYTTLKNAGSDFLRDKVGLSTQESRAAAITAEAQKLSAELKDQLGTQVALLRVKEQEINAAKALKEASASNTKSPQQQTQGVLTRLITAAATKKFVDEQAKAQEQVVKASRFNAAEMKKAYEKAMGDISAAVQSAFREVESLKAYFAGRTVTLRLAVFDKQAERSNAEMAKFQSGILESEKKRLELMGYSSEEIEQQLAGLKEMFEVSDKMRKLDQDEGRQRQVLVGIEEQIAQESERAADAKKKALDLLAQQKAAEGRGDKEGAYKFADDAAKEAQKAAIALEGLNELVKQFKAEAAKPVATQFGAKFIVSDEQIRSMVEAAAAARQEVALLNSKVLEKASGAFDVKAKGDEGFLKELKDRSEALDSAIAQITTASPAIAQMQSQIAKEVLGSVAGFTAMSDSLKSIANADLSGVTQFSDVASKAGEFKQIEESIGKIAAGYAGTIAQATTAAKDIPAALAETVLRKPLDQVLASIAASSKEASLTISANVKPEVAVTFPGVATSLQTAINAGTYTADITPRNGTATPKYAEGGHISGPGTGTSDSILSWLSNGEYVSDAQTTSFFGPSFFAALKKVARGGASGISSFATKMAGGVSLPAFAGGGFISPSLVGSGSSIAETFGGGRDNIVGRLAVDLNVGGEKVSLLGERGQVDRLVKALHRVNKG